MKNYFFYGNIERLTSDSIGEFLKEKEKIISFFRWPVPFTELKLDNLPSAELEKILHICKSSETLSNEFEWKSQFKTSESDFERKKFLYIVIENLHYLSHSNRDPVAFYKKLLDTCNYYSSRQNIYFILSCIKIPIPFVRENSYIEKWQFVDCNNMIDETLKKAESDHKKILSLLETLIPKLTKHQLIKVMDFIREPRGESPQVEDFKAFIDTREFKIFTEGLIDTESTFSSEVYIESASEPKEFRIPDYEIMEKHLRKTIIGQEETVQRFIDAVMISYSSLVKKESPRAIFLFVGPSGVGKTEICRQLKNFLPDYRFLQINLAEYNEKAAVDKLIGLGRGYEESEYGGILTEPVRCHPKHIILFDELDHAHSSVIQLFYKIFEGEITDGRGRKVSFRDCFIIMTTNKGEVKGKVSWSERRFKIEEELISTVTGNGKESIFKQSFLGRIDSIIQFNSLTSYDFVLIAAKYFKEKIIEPYSEIGISVNIVCAGARPALLEEGVFSSEQLFYEIFALMATQKSEQGARRLFQIMDEYLIHPIDIYRIKFRNTPAKKIEINITFTPFFPDGQDYDETTVLLADDEPSEIDKLRKLFENERSISFKINDFDEDSLQTEDTSLVLLDLYREKEDYGKNFLDRIADKIVGIPVSIYSALPSGPKLEQLKRSLWQYGISAYISKGDRDTVSKIRRFIQQYYLNEKLKTEVPIKYLELDPPIHHEQTLTFNLKWKT